MDTLSPPVGDSAKPSRALHVGLWVAQALLGLTFVGSGIWKALTPLPELAAMIPWAGQVPPAFLYFIVLVDLAGGLGVVLPSLTRVKPGLTVLAALGCALLQVSAIGFHFSRGEAANTPFNFFLVALSLFVCWGRWNRAPIRPRHA
ncbi:MULTISPECIES: DoxX family protein [unclassified Corallococcus]|uniref:DoxX family protein n=1 Tax=unclassified Corallococcus TaxID=2685029 RepID=UPI001A8DBAE8|nr:MULTISPECIES: DoxX family protein [unclassified Corallococcus]MBN9686995.1 DoxX family protein [Corallococcus sp. NCSPR001]WAS89173.1 DoxX family protein [Corallococcus sp. NCRR]